MAKKKQDFNLDDFGFDDELETPDFNFDSVPVKDDRSAVTSFGKSFAGGVKNEIVSPRFVTETIRKSLPKIYGSVFDLADQAFEDDTHGPVVVGQKVIRAGERRKDPGHAFAVWQMAP